VPVRSVPAHRLAAEHDRNEQVQFDLVNNENEREREFAHGICFIDVLFSE